MIRELTHDDIANAFAISQSRRKRSSSNTFTLEEIEKLVLANNCLGYFEDDRLVTWVSYRFGELHGEKIWCILNMFTSKFTNRFSFDGPDFGPIIKTLFEKAEAWQVYSYIYVVAEKVEKVYYEKWKSKGRYDTFDLARIPANTVPPENWMTRLIGGTLPYDCVIKKRTLKLEHRNDHDTAV